LIERYYWDSVNFISRLDRTPDRIVTLEAITDGAEKGELVIVTSTISRYEVCKVNVDPALTPEEQDRQIDDYFENPYILLVMLDDTVIKTARSIIRGGFGIKPNDAIHIASALRARCSVLHTYDDKMLRANGKIGDQPLRIEKPSYTKTLHLDLEDKDHE
jgi:predicted nucleic acid-binding protein